MAIQNKYFSSIGPSRYLFKNGKEAHFIDGSYLTDNKDEIEQLEAEIASRHPHLFVKEDEKTVDVEQLNVLDQIRKKAVDEYLAAQKLANDPNNDRGTSTPGPLGAANSATIQEAMGASNSSVEMTPVPAGMIKVGSTAKK